LAAGVVVFAPSVVRAQAGGSQVTAPAAAQRPAPTSSGFEQYKLYLSALARSQGISEATAREVLSLRLNQRAIDLDRAQRPSGTPSARQAAIAPYLRQHVTPTLIWRGQSLYYSLWPRLAAIEANYGVDSATLLGIYGKETSFGRVTGSFDLLEALTSLAWEGRRRHLFEKEALAAMQLLDAGVPRSRLRGSYAGATGYPQFMPSAVLRLRADGDGDGHADIWGNEADAMASIANFLREAGWKKGLPWGGPANVPPGLDRSAIQPTAQSSCVAERKQSRTMTVAEWRKLGVTPRGFSLADGENASLIEPLGEMPYLVTGNYRAILAYNCSNLYAMSVLGLADSIARRRAVENP
jgi:lytic murein transglycosylase